MARAESEKREKEGRKEVGDENGSREKKCLYYPILHDNPTLTLSGYMYFQLDYQKWQYKYLMLCHTFK